MKFVKVIIDGKESYRRVDETENTEASDTDPEIIDVEIEQDEIPTGGEKFLRDTQEFFERVGAGAREFGEKIVAGARDLGERIKTGTERLFTRDKSEDPESVEAKLLRLLPYMSPKEAHKVCEKLLENDETLKNLEISTIMPFLSAEDCDKVFVKCIEIKKDCDLTTAVPYVSIGCLSRVVDDYIDGKYPDLDIDSLYPFLGDEEIKKIFYHIIGG